jgi:hypothetical protein
MSVHVVSLIRSTPQVILPGQYTLVRFPFGGAESFDGHQMHQAVQPDGHIVTDWDADDRSGLIWPAVDGWGVLTAHVHWESGNYSELRDRFVRDPLGLTEGGYDSTATDHRPPSPGMQCFTKQHQMFVHPGVPLAFLATHNASSPRKVTHAQFKLAIHPVEES